MAVSHLEEFDWKMATKIGSGYYGNVFRVRSLMHRQKSFAIKELKTPPTLASWKREYSIYSALEKIKGVIKLRYQIFKNPTSSIPSHLVYDFVDSTSIVQLYPSLSLDDVRYYIYHILEIVSRIHQLNIIHGDLKPHNILINSKKRSVTLIDFGHAQFTFQKTRHPGFVGTRAYNAPELLLGWPHYGRAIDVWAIGRIMADMLMPYCISAFGSNQLATQILIIAKLFGSEPLTRLSAKLGRQIPPMNHYTECKIPDNFKIFWRKQPHKKTQQRMSSHLTDEVLDLLSKLMCLDPDKRINCDQALQHSFFYPLRTETRTK